MKFFWKYRTRHSFQGKIQVSSDNLTWDMMDDVSRVSAGLPSRSQLWLWLRCRNGEWAGANLIKARFEFAKLQQLLRGHAVTSPVLTSAVLHQNIFKAKEMRIEHVLYKKRLIACTVHKTKLTDSSGLCYLRLVLSWGCWDVGESVTSISCPCSNNAGHEDWWPISFARLLNIILSYHSFVCFQNIYTKCDSDWLKLVKDCQPQDLIHSTTLDAENENSQHKQINSRWRTLSPGDRDIELWLTVSDSKWGAQDVWDPRDPASADWIPAQPVGGAAAPAAACQHHLPQTRGRAVQARLGALPRVPGHYWVGARSHSHSHSHYTVNISPDAVLWHKK